MCAAPVLSEPPASAVPMPPRATARLQLHPDFTLGDAAGVVDYYAALGVSHLYLSPVFDARPGSAHGYDVTDFSRVRDALGGEAALVSLAHRARLAGLGLILDIVPNHMAADDMHNAWWRDVLARGPDSEFAGFFDIDWHPPDPGLRDKVLLPILAHPYWGALARGDLRLVPADGARPACLRYFEHELPLASGTLGAYEAAAPGWFDVTRKNGRAHLHALLECQHYRLAWWRTGAAMLNRRRFFEISDLVGLRQEHQPVFDATHALVFRLLREGHIDGVRVDHVDGLADPAAYCRRLREQLAIHAAQRPSMLSLPHPWLIVEKILAPGEALPEDWQVDGTTGYDFMDQIASVLHDASGEPPLTGLWERSHGDRESYGHVLRAARRQILAHHLVTEYESASTALHASAAASPVTRDLTRAALRRALGALLEAIPVYRSYLDDHPDERAPGAAAAEATMLHAAARTARTALAPEEVAALDFILNCLRMSPVGGAGPTYIRQKLQQLMPAVAAKAAEDTAFYRYGRLLSRNEVGSVPSTIAISPAQFHADMSARLQAFPHAMLATATHDHKRGEDARMRLAVLSEVADEWVRAVAEWELQCSSVLAALPRTPDTADRLMLYQTLLGAWPMQTDALTRKGELEAFLHRVGEWQRKANREAKRYGTWTWPNLDYEAACEAFLQSLVIGWPESGVLAGIGQFVQRVAPAGAVNSLAQAIVQLTAPGVPDRYQGCEVWDFSLVDPDNRHTPDFIGLRAQLDCTAGWAHWLRSWRDGRLKLQIIHHALAARRKHEAVFAQGAYHALSATGPLAPHVLAFSRTTGKYVAVTVVTRLAARLACPTLLRIPPACWGHTTLDVSAPEDSQWVDALTGKHLVTIRGRLSLRTVLSVLPVALLFRQA